MLYCRVENGEIAQGPCRKTNTGDWRPVKNVVPTLDLDNQYLSEPTLSLEDDRVLRIFTVLEYTDEQRAAALDTLKTTKKTEFPAEHWGAIDACETIMDVHRYCNSVELEDDRV